ncbi:MAG TPA: SagB/ThcOx family dehydrogenase [Dissulfurispiraceae bacterium]|nr:SagB/ThcOx family dehydrogenase [Dissulfurispiraceae bacterium]
MREDAIQQFRFFLKDSIRKMIDFSETDQNRMVPPPPLQKPYPADAVLLTLPKKQSWTRIPSVDLLTAATNRRSHRSFVSDQLTVEELAFLLWITQGIRQIAISGTAFRVVPSAGCRHALETYLCIMNVEGVHSGLYRYLPIEHALLQIERNDKVHMKIVEATLRQSFTGAAAVTFIWTALPYRMEWRYDLAAHKVIALDAGHVCQNLYLACEAIGCGCCAIAAYDQDLMDRLVHVDGVDEFTLYLATVGKI